MVETVRADGAQATSVQSTAAAPCLAESWSACSNDKSYEFVLRKDAKLHNGEPVTSTDVKFSFERYMGRGSMGSARLSASRRSG